MIEVDELQIVDVLQKKMAGVKQDIAARVVIHLRQKSLKRDTVMQVFAGMYFITEVHTVMVKTIQHRQPASRQLSKRLIKQSFMVWRPGIEPGPGERAGKSGMCAQAEFFRRGSRTLQCSDGPVGAPGGIASQHSRRKIIKSEIVCGVNGNQLPFQMR